MNEPLDISQAIIEKIDEIEKLKKSHKNAIDLAAEAMSNYDRNLALTMTKLRNKVEMSMLDNDGIEVDIKDLPVTVLEKVAKGIIYETRLELEKAQGYVSGIKSNLAATCAQLNGLQSINRHLGEL